MKSTISLLFAGDYAPCRRYESLVLQKGAEIFGDLQQNITEADLSFLNLETPLCIEGKPIKKTGSNFKAHPDCINAVKDAGFNIVGLANNHIMDYGSKGLQETIQNCTSASLNTCGAGKNLLQAQRVPIIKSGSLKIAYIAVAEHEFSISSLDKAGAAPLDPVDNIQQIESVRNQADLVIVSIHGGNEYFPLPRPGLRKLCRFYITHGADAVICHHTHVSGAYEIYNNKPIVYSLGNLIFDRQKPPKNWNEGYVVRLDYNIMDKELSKFNIFPYTQSVEQGGLRKMLDNDESSFLKKIDGYNKILADNTLYEKAWDNFCQNQKKLFLFNNYMPFHFKGMRKLSNFINPEFFLAPTKKNRRIKLNLVRCESHLEVLKSILSDKE